MPDDSIEAGVGSLDEDLRALLDFCESERLQQLQDAIARDTLTEQQFVGLVPEGALRVANALSSPVACESVREIVSENARPLIRKAEALVRDHFDTILRNPIVRRVSENPIVRRAFEKMSATQEERTAAASVRDSFNIISGTSSLPTWVGSPPELRPTVRIGFLDKNGRLLLDSFLTWDDLLFLVGSLINVLAEQLEAGRELAKLQQLELGNTAKLADRIQDITKTLSKIKSLAPVYGIEVRSADSGQDRQAPQQE